MNKEQKSDYYVYIWIIKETGEVFYVGKGRAGRAKNISHRSPSFKEIYNSNNCEVKIIEDNLTDENARCKEIYWIKFYRESGHPLVNKTSGGEPGNHSRWLTEERKDYLRKQTRDKNPNYGHKWTDEMKEAASKRVKESQRYNGCNNPRATKIRCLETGEVFQYIKLAMEKYNVKYQASFTYALNYPTRTCAGLHWERCS